MKTNGQVKNGQFYWPPEPEKNSRFQRPRRQENKWSGEEKIYMYIKKIKIKNKNKKKKAMSKMVQ